jgi:hypothetical protein
MEGMLLGLNDGGAILCPSGHADPDGQNQDAQIPKEKLDFHANTP